MERAHVISVMVAALALPACGGGTDLAVPAAIPGPVAQNSSFVAPANEIGTQLTPLAPTSGLIAGTFDTIAVVERQTASGATIEQTQSPDQFQITIDPATLTYTVNMAVPGLLAERSFDLGHVFHGTCCSDTISEFGQHVVKTDAAGQIIDEYDSTSGYSKSEVPQTTVAPKAESYYLRYDLGLSYVSFGVWGRIDWEQGGYGGFRGAGQPDKIYFVHGFRTAADDIPVTGTATYNLAVMMVERPTAIDGGSATFSEPVFDTLLALPASEMPNSLALTADFGTRSISAELNIPPARRWESYVIDRILEEFPTEYAGLIASGVAPFTSVGDFSIPLSGNVVDRDWASNQPDTLTPLQGSVVGAFYGPQADQLGGLLQLTRDGGQTIITPFAAQKN